MQHVDEELPVLAALLRFVEGQRAKEQLLVVATQKVSNLRAAYCACFGLFPPS